MAKITVSTQQDLENKINNIARTASTSFYFCNKNLVTIPESMRKLVRITHLYLGDNSLEELPDSVTGLVKLTNIDISNNKLVTLPDSIIQWSNVSVLYLNGNILKSLPESIGQMKNLTHLDLRGNKLEYLPESIGGLVNLTFLDLSGNKLEYLPESIIHLVNLKYINLDGNPIRIPDEIVGDQNNVQLVLKYLSDLKKVGKRPLNEAKMVLVGEARNGKTSLAKCLMGGRFDPNQTKTDGIDILQWPININRRKIRLNVWDLGGQEIYHATHQFFLTERTLYVLVLNSRQTDAQNRLDYWLKTIRNLGKDAPILIVQNQHETNPQELNRKLLREKYPSIVGFYQTSCTRSWGISDLSIAIKNVISSMQHVCDEVPESYFQVKERLEKDDRDYLSLEEYEAFCDAEKLEDPESQNILLRLLHELGIVLSFDDFRLKDTNVLNPEWVTHGVYQILDYAPLRTTGKAILRPELLRKILPVKRYPRNKQRFVVEMMEKFELCFQREGREEWLIPELLAPDEPEDTGDFTDALRFEYHYDFLPASVLPRFIVRTHTLRQTYYWRDGVVIESGSNQARVRADIDDKKIKIEVSGNPNTRRDLLAQVRGQFAHIHYTLQGMVAKEMIPVPSHPEVDPVPYTFLLQLEQKRTESFRWIGVDDELKVADLLNGVEATRAVPYEPTRTTPRTPIKDTKVMDIDDALKPLAELNQIAEDNERYLRQLARVVQEDKLVPFVGAGMSIPVGLKSWTEALEYLYTNAEDSLTARQAREFGEARARWALEEAAQVLWEALGDRWFNDRIRALFGQDMLSAAKIAAAPVSLLPQIANGPVLTTNFDAILEQVYGDFTEVTLGDYRADRILNNFDDKKHFLLKLHGDADEGAGRVLTKAQYDRAYDEAGGSRLPELLRALFGSRRPMLFLGCSLALDRTMTELQTAGLHMRNAYHFALLSDPGKAERGRRQNELVGQLGIQPIWLRDFNDVRPILEFLVRVRR